MKQALQQAERLFNQGLIDEETFDALILDALDMTHAEVT